MNEKTKKAAELIKQKVEKFQNSSEYLEFMKFVAGFHSYSFQNRLLIWAQNPKATIVGGMKTWNKKGRKVKKGEKALTIYAPCTVKKEEENEEGEKVEKYYVTGHYRTVPVFDISQTEGPEIPNIEPKDLKGKVNKFQKIIDGIKKLIPKNYSFLFDDEKSSEKGFIDYSGKRIVVHKASQLQMLKTSLHELGHYLLDHENREIDRQQKECEAESVAFIVCNHLGYDTTDYSEKYIAGWKGNKEFVEDSLTHIIKVADKIIEGIENELNKKSS